MAVPLTTRILLADDHTVVRRGLRMVLEAQPDLTVVAEAGDGIEAVERGLREPVDLAVIDVAMPRRTGLDAARELLRHRPDMRILMLSMHDVEEFCFQALKAGASGYVLKTVADKELVDACRAAMRGEPFLSPPTIRDADARLPRRRCESPLTPREREVVKLIAEAHTTEQIAALLVISPRTVERHRENILAKLGMRDRVEITRWAIRHGLDRGVARVDGRAAAHRGLVDVLIRAVGDVEARRRRRRRPECRAAAYQRVSSTPGQSSTTGAAPSTSRHARARARARPGATGRCSPTARAGAPRR